MPRALAPEAKNKVVFQPFLNLITLVPEILDNMASTMQGSHMANYMRSLSTCNCFGYRVQVQEKDQAEKE